MKNFNNFNKSSIEKELLPRKTNNNLSILKKDGNHLTLSNNKKENRKNMNMKFNIQTNTVSNTISNANNSNNNQQNPHKKLQNNTKNPTFNTKYQNKSNKKNENNIKANWNIPYQNLRVIDTDGKMIGVLKKEQAINLAESKNLDLVLIDERQDPPITRILNFEKYRFEKQKQDRIEKSLRRKQNLDTKEIYFRPTTNDHDIQIKLKQSREFLNKGHKVLFSVKMKGREISHANLAIDILKKVKESLSDISQVIKDIQSKENRISMILQPKKQ